MCGECLGRRIICDAVRRAHLQKASYSATGSAKAAAKMAAPLRSSGRLTVSRRRTHAEQ